MSTTLIIIAGVVVFSLATLASLWAGYLIFQRAWAIENPELPGNDEDIKPLVGRYEVLQSRRPIS